MIFPYVSETGAGALSISQAKPDCYPTVRDFYYEMIDGMQDAEYSPAWKKDIYPDAEMLEKALKGGNIYFGHIQDTLAAVVILNHECEESYDRYEWTVPASREETLFVHALGVLPGFSGKGIGKAMVRFALEFAREQQLKTVRLDVLKGNLPAEKLYPSVGFLCLGKARLYYEDTGWTDFLLHEYVLED